MDDYFEAKQQTWDEMTGRDEQKDAEKKKKKIKKEKKEKEKERERDEKKRREEMEKKSRERSTRTGHAGNKKTGQNKGLLDEEETEKGDMNPFASA